MIAKVATSSRLSPGCGEDAVYGRFAVDNFRGVEHIDLDRMSPVNLLVGDNGSGQATMLEALRLHAAPGMAGALDAPNHLRVLPPYVAAPWTWLFVNLAVAHPSLACTSDESDV